MKDRPEKEQLTEGVDDPAEFYRDKPGGIFNQFCVSPEMDHLGDGIPVEHILHIRPGIGKNHDQGSNYQQEPFIEGQPEGIIF